MAKTETSEIIQFTSKAASSNIGRLTRSQSEGPRFVSDASEQPEILKLEDKVDDRLTVKQEAKTEIKSFLPAPKPQFLKMERHFSPESQPKQILTEESARDIKKASSSVGAQAKQQPSQLSHPPQHSSTQPVSAHYSSSSKITKETVPPGYASERTTVSTEKVCLTYYSIC